MSDALDCFCARPDLDVARTFVAARHTGGVKVLPGGSSNYRWQRAVHAEAAVLLPIRTSARAYPALETFLRASHPGTPGTDRGPCG